MENRYQGHDGMLNALQFNNWVMSAEGTKRLFYNTDSRLNVESMYRFKDATIRFNESGDHRDGSPIEIIVEGDTEKNVNEICGYIEEHFPYLRQK